jgi:hypothetical protein
LSAFSPAGIELQDPAARNSLAQDLGVMAAPCLRGSLHELRSQLPRLASAGQANSTGSTSQRQQQQDLTLSKVQKHSTPAYEGWIITAADASREKVGCPMHELMIMMQVEKERFFAHYPSKQNDMQIMPSTHKKGNMEQNLPAPAPLWE